MAKKTWTQRGGRATYGRTALSAKIKFDGFGEFFERIEKLGKNVNSACAKAINETLPIIEKSMREGAERHRDTGDVVENIEVLKATRGAFNEAGRHDTNYIYGLVGIDLKKHPEAFEAVFQEYGDGHSPDFPDPFIRPAVDDNKRQINATIKKVLRKEGMPVE